MVEKDPTTVSAAFETLLEEMETEIEFINQSGVKAFAARNYGAVRAVLQRVDQITAVREKLATLRLEWETLPLVVSTNGREQLHIRKQADKFCKC